MREALLQQVLHWTPGRTMVEGPLIDDGLNALGKILESPLIEEGMSGEVVASLLLLRAYVLGHCLAFTGKHTFKRQEDYPRDRRPSRGEFYGHKPCFSEDLPVSYFIEALFPPKSASTILDGLFPYNRLGSNFSTAFKGATLRFSGFERAADDIIVSAEGLRAAYIRGFAIIGHKTQEGLDFFLPVRLKDDHFTFLGIQVKNRREQIKNHSLIFDAGKYGVFGDPAKQEPYLVLVMQLGVRVPTDNSPRLILAKMRKGKAKETGKRSAPIPTTPRSHRDKPSPTTPRPSQHGHAQQVLTTPDSKLIPANSPLVGRHSNDAHPIYMASVLGCTEETYRVIQQEERDHFARMLARRDINQEHPRQGKAFQKLLKRTKSEWFMGQECFDWIEEPLLQGRKDSTVALQPVAEERETEVEEVIRDEGGSGRLQVTPEPVATSSPLTSPSDGRGLVNALPPLTSISDDDPGQHVQMPADVDNTREGGESMVEQGSGPGHQEYEEDEDEEHDEDDEDDESEEDEEDEESEEDEDESYDGQS